MIRRNANGATSEDTEQIHVMQWAEITANRGGAFEKLRLLFHIPNGGARSKAEGAIFKAMGVKSGVPDLFLPVPMELVRDDGYSAISSGLFIEMKAHGGRVQPNQKCWLNDLVDSGYCCCVCYGEEEAEKALEDYLEGRFPEYGKPDRSDQRMTPEADLLARVMLVLWEYRAVIPGAGDLLDEYEALVMDTDEGL